jgi:hypothetical protein
VTDVANLDGCPIISIMPCSKLPIISPYNTVKTRKITHNNDVVFKIDLCLLFNVGDIKSVAKKAKKGFS